MKRAWREIKRCWPVYSLYEKIFVAGTFPLTISWMALIIWASGMERRVR